MKPVKREPKIYVPRSERPEEYTETIVLPKSKQARRAMMRNRRI